MITTAKVSLRPETAEDTNFIEELFIADKDEQEGWRHLLPSERTKILKSQSRYQLDHYRKNFPHAWFCIIEVDGKPAGRFYVNQTPKEMRVVDISILPEYRQHGIGSTLIQQIITESQRLNLPLRLRVDPLNPALGFYQKLGFVVIANEESRLHLEWKQLPA